MNPENNPNARTKMDSVDENIVPIPASLRKEIRKEIFSDLDDDSHLRGTLVPEDQVIKTGTGVQRAESSARIHINKDLLLKILEEEERKAQELRVAEEAKQEELRQTEVSEENLKNSTIIFETAVLKILEENPEEADPYHAAAIQLIEEGDCKSLILALQKKQIRLKPEYHDEIALRIAQRRPDLLARHYARIFTHLSADVSLAMIENRQIRVVARSFYEGVPKIFDVSDQRVQKALLMAGEWSAFTENINGFDSKVQCILVKFFGQKENQTALSSLLRNLEFLDESVFDELISYCKPSLLASYFDRVCNLNRINLRKGKNLLNKRIILKMIELKQSRTVVHYYEHFSGWDEEVAQALEKAGKTKFVSENCELFGRKRENVIQKAAQSTVKKARDTVCGIFKRDKD